MKKLVEKLKSIWAIKELKERILYTVLFILIYRLGSFVIIPGVDSTILTKALSQQGDNGIVALINQFAGGAFSRASIFALGIMPYITASIVIQLLGMAVPQFQKLQKEGESGRKKMQTYTKLLTIVVTVVQAPTYLAAYIPPESIISPGLFFNVTAVAIIVASTMFIMWLGEKITEKGVGNGVSLLITVGIIARLPQAFFAEFLTKLEDAAGGRLLFIFVEMIIWFFIILFTILVIKGVRKVPLEYPKQMIAGGAINKTQNGGRRYLPLKVAMAGVMPIIFAQAIMFLPQSLATASFLGDTTKGVFQEIANPNTIWYSLTTALFIVIFTYFYTAMIINPRQMADDFKRQGAYIPGVKPGVDTANFIDNVMTKITFPGSLFLASIAILPYFARLGGVSNEFSYFFGGTSLLIMVGVVLDTMLQIDNYVVMRHYDGLMKTGKLRGGESLSESSPLGGI
ncbi:MAG: preprotein translocase subunit SecY [Saprospiraceae bacterium]|jgi:preprotein translocase subunit SecY